MKVGQRESIWQKGAGRTSLIGSIRTSVPSIVTTINSFNSSVVGVGGLASSSSSSVASSSGVDDSAEVGAIREASSAEPK